MWLWVLVGLTTAVAAPADDAEAETATTSSDAARPRSPWGGAAILSTAFVAGPVNSGLSGRTLDGTWSFGSTFNPRLDVGLALRALYRTRAQAALSLAWSVRRDVLLVDTTTEGFSPGVGGTTSTTVVDTSDLLLSYADDDVVAGWPGDVHLAVGGRLTIPASYASLVCDPLVTVLGASVGSWVRLPTRTVVRLSVGGDRLFHAYPAAPRERCGVPLRGTSTVATLAGPVAPTPYEDTFAAGVSHPAWAADATLSLTDWHRVFGLLPRVAGSKALDRVTTDVAIGARLHVARVQPAASVQTLSGDVEVEATSPPSVWSFPWSIGVGVAVADHLVVRTGLSNAAPQLAYDPTARLRVLPATTTVSVALAGAW